MNTISQDRVAVVLADRLRIWKALQGGHRLVTGINEPGRAPKRSTPIRMLMKDLGWLGASMFAAGAGASIAAASPVAALAGIPVAAGGIVLAVGRLRRLVVSHVHEASHGIVADFYRKRGKSAGRARLTAEAILDIGSSISLTLNGQDYRSSHKLHHEFEHLGTLTDPDGATLKAWHIWPDETRSLRATLLATALNPLWHMRFLRDRIHSNVARGKLYRRAIGAASLGVLLGSAFLLPLPIWLAAVFVPFVPGYQIATLAQLTTIHSYGHPRAAVSLEDYAQRTWERIPYQPMPEPGARVAAWLRWFWAMVGHAIARAAVLDDTMIAHRHHHPLRDRAPPSHLSCEGARLQTFYRHARRRPSQETVGPRSGDAPRNAAEIRRGL